jgi:hypothetical protein
VASLSIPLSLLSTAYGKGLVLFLGSAAYVTLASLYLSTSAVHLGHWNVVWFIYVLFGLGRLTYEMTTKVTH